MSDKRKPDITIIAVIHGKRQRVEAFSAQQFFTPEQWQQSWIQKLYGRKYRLRVNGRWWPKIRPGKVDHVYYWKTEIRDLFWNAVKKHF